LAKRKIKTLERAERPIVVVIAGANGAGKSTAAPRLLKAALRVTEFLNADLIARGLSPFDPEGAAVAAGAVLLKRMDDLAARSVSFGMESTLAGRSLALRLRNLVARGYEFHLVFLYLPSADLAVGRVADRVRLGGHNVPEATIRRRYEAGLQNFFRFYQSIATTWRVFDNSRSGRMDMIARGRQTDVGRVFNRDLWRIIEQEYRE
jgi:predicted ABC-type ATPase